MTRAAVPEDMDALTVPAGTWAVFESSGRNLAAYLQAVGVGKLDLG